MVARGGWLLGNEGVGEMVGKVRELHGEYYNLC